MRSLALMVLIVAACGTTPTISNAEEPPSNNFQSNPQMVCGWTGCTKPIADFFHKPRASYRETKEQIILEYGPKAIVDEGFLCSDPSMEEGGVRYIKVETGFTEQTRIYLGGRLLAVLSFTDNIEPVCGGWTLYGEVPKACCM